MKLNENFFRRDVLDVAPELIGKRLCRSLPDGTVHRLVITETESYRGVEDGACHASKGRTARTDVLFRRGGLVYVYLIYGMHILLNVVTGEENKPQAVLIRACEGYSGPGKLTRALSIDRSFYGEDICRSERLWVEDAPPVGLITAPRVGIDYAPPEWRDKPWRYILRPATPKGENMRYAEYDFNGLLLRLCEDGFGLCGIFPGGKGPDGFINASSPLLERAAKELREYFLGERLWFDLPLSPRGTPFQLAVWRALREIPYGETRSYGEIAAALGRPGAGRAVGAACGRNPLLIMIPCHRVVGKNGSLTGFTCGLALKERLLQLEERVRQPRETAL